MQNKQLEELILQALEHELGGVKVYETALACVRNPELQTEWQRYLKETQTHVTSLTDVCSVIGLDASRETSGRKSAGTSGGAWSKPRSLGFRAGDR